MTGNVEKKRLIERWRMAHDKKMLEGMTSVRSPELEKANSGPRPRPEVERAMTEIEWSRMKAYQVNARQAGDAIVIVPIGSFEQHGPYLPVQVDALLAGEVARRAGVKISADQPVIVTPTVRCGLAEHHMSFGGTIMLDFDTFQSVLRCICRSLIRQGFSKILLLQAMAGALRRSAHLGYVKSGIRSAHCDHHLLGAAREAFAELLKHQTTIGHACEAETSMLLALKPELVEVEAANHVEAPEGGLYDQGGVHIWRSTSYWTPSGVIGKPSAATAEKGEALLEAAATAIA